jgi:hypothetical protein
MHYGGTQQERRNEMAQYARGAITHWCEEDDCDEGFASQDDLDRHQREDCVSLTAEDMWGYYEDEDEDDDDE